MNGSWPSIFGTGVLLGSLLTACAPGETTAGDPLVGTRSESAAGEAGAAAHVSVEDDVRLFYRAFGHGDEVLIVPNGCQLGELAGLADGRRVILYDGRGRGRSDRVDPSRLSMKRDVEDLEALRRGLGLERISLLGTSYYGALVALYAADHPEHVERVVMVAPLPVASEELPASAMDDDELAPELAELRGRGVHLRDPPAYCRAYYRADAGSFFDDPRLMERMDLGFCDLPNEWPDRFEAWAEAIFASIPGWDWSARASAVSAPVLVVQGAEDRVVPPASARRWARALPAGRTVVLPATGHLPWLERPEAFFAAVTTFLDGSWPEAGRDSERSPVVAAGSLAP